MLKCLQMFLNSSVSHKFLHIRKRIKRAQVWMTKVAFETDWVTFAKDREACNEGKTKYYLLNSLVDYFKRIGSSMHVNEVIPLIGFDSIISCNQ